MNLLDNFLLKVPHAPEILTIITILTVWFGAITFIIFTFAYIWWLFEVLF